MENDGAKAKRAHDYELGHTDWELKRLASQAALIDPFTRQFFVDAGIVPGMRILDVGSGAGDVAILVAGLVGDAGEVVGVDRSEAAVRAAQARTRAASLSNITFREGDPTTLAFDRPFDAAVGRYVLMFNSDPAALLRGTARHLRPGGVIVFHEVDWTGAQSRPTAPLYDRCVRWVVDTFEKNGTHPYMGLNLFSAFEKAGLPNPSMGLSALVGGGRNLRSGIDLLADLAVTMAPIMENLGVVRTAEVDPSTLKQRMLAEVDTLGSVVVGRSEVGTWARVQ
jgi:SAM-dependent methyltransferase